MVALRSPSNTSIIPLKDIDALRCHTARSGFRNVYLNRSTYFAKVKIRGVLQTIGSAMLPHQAAQIVAAWYRDRFGERWHEVLRRRKQNPWKVTYSRKYAGFVLTLWEFGAATLVVPLTREGKPDRRIDRPIVFPTKLAAVEAIWPYLVRKYGLFAMIALYKG